MSGARDVRDVLVAEGIDFVDGRASLAQRITNEELAGLLDESDASSLDEPGLLEASR